MRTMTHMARKTEGLKKSLLDNKAVYSEEEASYPYGLCLCLTHEELEKLNLDSDVEVGDAIHLFALAECTSINKSKGADGEECVRIELQITHLGLEDEDMETAPDYDE